MTKAARLECDLCGKRCEAGTKQNLCACGGQLLVRYDLDRFRAHQLRDQIENGPPSMWRYAALLPPADNSIVTLGEGWTPLLQVTRSAGDFGVAGFLLKDEGSNPTGSFQARGLSCAVSMCVELGIGKVAIASAGNAAGALAAYAAAAGLEAHVFAPRGLPRANYVESKAFGAEVTLVDGTFSDCALLAAARSREEGWFDLTVLREPYRLEGSKTLGFEVAEQMGWEPPDAILCPAGGAAIAGLWKAFEEMEALGWTARRPRIIAVQAEGCRPVVRAFETGAAHCDPWENAYTVANGLRVPDPPGGSFVLRAVRESGGTAVAVSDEEMLDTGLRLASGDGIFAAPEGAACVAALPKLLAAGSLKPDDRIVVCNTGSGLKYTEAYAVRFPRAASGEQDKLGGLITPR